MPWGLDDFQQVDQGVLGHFRGLHSLQGGCFHNLWFAKLYVNHNFISILLTSLLTRYWYLLIFRCILWSLKLWYDLYFAKTIFSCYVLLHLLTRYAALQKPAFCFPGCFAIAFRSPTCLGHSRIQPVLSRWSHEHFDERWRFLALPTSHFMDLFNAFFEGTIYHCLGRSQDAWMQVAFLTHVQIDLKVSDVKWRRPCESVKSDSISCTWKLGLELQIWQMSGKVWRL